MKNTLIILSFLLSNTIGATTYYISTSGSDSNNGSIGTPWKTLAYACSKANASGDIIHINAGTYYETSQSILAVGVSIVGEGMTSTLIQSSYAGSSQPLIKAETSNGWLGVYGNQSISGITLNGNMTTFAAITVNFRSNFIIHDCTFTNFTDQGVMFSGQPEWNFTANNPYRAATKMATYWCSGNQFYNNVMTNCATMSGDLGNGNLRIGTQQGLLIHHNVITQTARAAGTNGYGIKYCELGYNKGTKCHDNIITIAPNVSGTYDFAFEIWWDIDECEYYNNTIQGCIDCGGFKDVGAYAMWFHDNTMGWASQQDHDEIGIDIEGYNDGVIINNNKITNCNLGILNSIEPHQDAPYHSVFNDFHIYDNLITGVGSTAGGGGNAFGITFGATVITADVSNYYIYNNTIVSSGNYGAGSYAVTGINLCDFGVNANGVQIKNNIIKGFTGGSTYFGPITAHGTSNYLNLSITNNDFYGNANSNAVQWTGSFSPGTGYVNSSNITEDPLFTSSSNFQLQSGSPAIGTGTNVGLSTDYAGNVIKNPPSIGAYESSSTALAPVLPVYVSSVLANATPSILEMTYNMTLANIVPATSSFSVLVNSAVRSVSAVVISGTKVQLTLATAVKYGDLVTVAYTKPSANPLQSPTGGVAISFSPQSVGNNLVISTKDATPLTVTMAISPNHVHKILNVLLTYSTTPTAANSPEVIQITDLAGNLLIEKLLVTGVTNILIPLNLASGIYNVLMSAGGSQLASKRMIVY
jgi:uncharacterized repeat protein (TIGR02059 family)